ncbi:hypothetical protein D7Y27_25765 [Corallococcus sp. AB004]|nr:hypothetical protein D7Y27_25765 [Corallococcus sp. AB004]
MDAPDPFTGLGNTACFGASSVLSDAGDRIYFSTNDELWRSDGTPGGTFRVHEKLRFSPSAPILSGVPNGPLLFAEEAPGGHGGAAPSRTERAGQYLLRVRDRFSARRYG